MTSTFRRSCTPIVVLVTLSVYFAALSYAAPQDLEPPPSILTEDETAFLTRHWQDTIPPQGTPPEDYSKLESSLQAQDCGACHQQQFKEWQTSLHSKSMGPGVLGQLVDLVETSPATARACWSCHTPLAEQQNKLFNAQANVWHKNPNFNIELQQHGLICAACHVRKHRRFGPPRQGEPNSIGQTSNPNLPHGGFTATSVFSKSGFCRKCHQFSENGFALNGKLLENTYNEWSDSAYAARGIHCQNCHMPKRRHLWRGIHDAQMVKNAIMVTSDIHRTTLNPGDNVEATMRVINSGVGHFFPTYLTPKVFVRAYLIDANETKIATSRQEAVIGRDATLDLSQEFYDTRLPPNETAVITYTEPAPLEAKGVRVEIAVEPDHYYEKFYTARLSSNISEQSRKLLTQALENARRSAFNVFSKTTPIEVKRRESQPSHVRPKQAPTNVAPPDWNEKNIRWLSYTDGIRLANETGRPILAIFYTDWCPTCHAYKMVFRDPKVIELTENFIMVRVNIGDNPRINQRYSLDGDYVPRTFALNANGTLVEEVHTEKSFPRYFVKAGDPKDFLRLMQRVVALP